MIRSGEYSKNGFHQGSQVTTISGFCGKNTKANDIRSSISLFSISELVADKFKMLKFGDVGIAVKTLTKFQLRAYPFHSFSPPINSVIPLFLHL